MAGRLTEDLHQFRASRRVCISAVFANNKTVIRGGLGFSTLRRLGSVFYSVAGIHDRLPGCVFSILVDPCSFNFPRSGSGGSGNSGFGTQNYRTANQYDKKDPYSIQWNLTVERVLHGNTALRVSYIANRGDQLTWGPDWNQAKASGDPNTPPGPKPFPAFHSVYSRAAGAVQHLPLDADRSDP